MSLNHGCAPSSEQATLSTYLLHIVMADGLDVPLASHTVSFIIITGLIWSDWLLGLLQLCWHWLGRLISWDIEVMKLLYMVSYTSIKYLQSNVFAIYFAQ